MSSATITAKTAVSESFQSVSLFKKRLKKFRSLKRGYYSFLLIVVAYIVSFLAPLLMNYKALVVRYDGRLHFPVFKFYEGKVFGQDIYGEADYRRLKESFSAEDKGNWVLMPPYPFGPYESLTDPSGTPPNPPSRQHWFGTDDRGRDVFVRLVYGFNISLSFALICTAIAYAIGISVGAALGYFGGKFDIFAQRLIEIWSSMPFLYTIIIVSSIIRPNFALLVFLLVLFGWMGMTYYIRGEFYREKAKDYVHAAISMGAGDRKIVFKHILPNALTPVIALGPFHIVADIFALVSLDFLGFGLPPPTPSWGELLGQGVNNVHSWWLTFFPFGAMFCTLLMVVFIGEGVRQAFDPREYSRLR
ncbi:MAG: ABC transporter permease subunit [Calditrichaeota bacterium]|nr:ABC transporter permease subunit [Calditrichota bacterium]